MIITYNFNPLFKKDLGSISKSYLKLKLWVVKLLKMNIENYDLTIKTQDAVIWQYNMYCPNCCPAQIFNSVLWKTQYIRLSYGLCLTVTFFNVLAGCIARIATFVWNYWYNIFFNFGTSHMIEITMLRMYKLIKLVLDKILRFLIINI